MRRNLFLGIINALGNHDEYCQTRFDAAGKMGLLPLLKCNVAIHILAYGSLTDIVDGHVQNWSNYCTRMLRDICKRCEPNI